MNLFRSGDAYYADEVKTLREEKVNREMHLKTLESDMATLREKCGHADERQRVAELELR
jgi:hypothetical protein